MGRLIILLLSTIVAAVFTLNAFWLQWNGSSTIEIINRLPVLFTPSNYVYSIWIVLFIFLLLWLIKYQTSKKMVTSIQFFLYLFILLLQITAIVCWNNEQFIASLILSGLQLISLFVLYLTYPLHEESIQMRYPIAAYLSWTLFFTILTFCYVLVHIQWHGFGLSNALWAVLVMTLGTAIVLHLRYHHYDVVTPIVFIWCYIGIAISNGFDELLVSTAALFLCGVMYVGIVFMKKKPDSSN